MIPLMKDQLTKTELEVIRLLASGMSNKQIAATRHVNVSTTRNQLGRIYKKLIPVNHNKYDYRICVVRFYIQEFGLTDTL